MNVKIQSIFYHFIPDITKCITERTIILKQNWFRTISQIILNFHKQCPNLKIIFMSPNSINYESISFCPQGLTFLQRAFKSLSVLIKENRAKIKRLLKIFSEYFIFILLVKLKS